MGIMDHLAAAEFERRVQARARVKDMADRVDLLDRLALLRLLEEREDLACRVAELEAKREPAATEWGARWGDCSCGELTIDRDERATDGGEAYARRVVSIHDPYRRGTVTLVQRDVYEPGPWREAQ